MRHKGALIMKKKEMFDIVFRDQDGGGWSKCGFDSLTKAMKFADKLFNESNYSYYVITLENCTRCPYGEIAIFRGDQTEYTKNNGISFQEKQHELSKWNKEFLQVQKEMAAEK